MRRPTGLSPISNFRVKASFTITTFGRPSTSPSVKARPLSTGIPSVVKKPGPTLLKAADTLVSGPASNPSTDTLLFQLEPASSGTIEKTARSTPGSALSSCSTRSKKARVRCVS
ncbi:MAG: hypothetical protein R2712_22495 [Vicinamibacterales bacterium]